MRVQRAGHRAAGLNPGERTPGFPVLPLRVIREATFLRCLRFYGVVLGHPASSLFPPSRALTSLRSLHLKGDRPPRVTSGTKRGSTGSESRAAACIDHTKAGRVMLLRDSRERPQLRYCHARPGEQAPTNHCGAYTNSGQSAPVLFPSPARSSPGCLNPVPAPTVAAVAFAAAASGADSGIPAPGSLRCPR